MSDTPARAARGLPDYTEPTLAELQSAGERFKELLWEYLDVIRNEIETHDDTQVRDEMNGLLDTIDGLPEGQEVGSNNE